MHELGRQTFSRLAFEGRINLMGAWTPDGKRIAFSSSRLGPQNPYWQSSDGSGAAERISSSEFTTVLGSMPLNGQALAAVEVRPDTGYDIVVFNFVDHKLEPFLRTRFTEGGPAFSPDGRWIAYMSDESGRPEIYVQPYPGPGGKWQISAEAGTEPVWNPNGRELFYRNGEEMMAVDVATATIFSAGKPKLLF